jgi:hypothetical protein
VKLDDGTVVRIDPETDEHAVWVRGGEFLQRVDAESFEVEQIRAPEQGGGEALVAFGSVWATAYDEATLYRLSPG